MSEPPTPPLRIVHLSIDAWSLLQAQAIEQHNLAHSHHIDPATEILAQYVASLSPTAQAAAWTELIELSLAEAVNAVKASWLNAVTNYRLAPTQVVIEARYAGVSGLGHFAIEAGQGIGSFQRRTLESVDGAEIIVGEEQLIELILFSETHFWSATQRALPPLEQLRAPANTSQPTLAVGSDPSKLLLNAEATVVASVITQTVSRNTVWSGFWAVSAGQLYAMRSSKARLVAYQDSAGSIARELIFALVGSHELLASGARS